MFPHESLCALLSAFSIPFKENDKNVIVLCPYCLDEGKRKIKLYIDKQSGIWHCFRCENSGNILKLKEPLVKLGFPISDVNKIISKFIIHTLKNPKDIKNVESARIAIDKLKDELNEFLRKYTIDIHDSKNADVFTFIERRKIDAEWFYERFKRHVKFGTNGYVKDRLIFLTYFRTSFNARSIYSLSPKYIKYHRSSSSIADYVMYRITDTNTVVFFEGVFDAIKFIHDIESYGNIANIGYVGALGGYMNISGLLSFVKFMNFKRTKIVIVLDADVDISQVIHKYKKAFFEDSQNVYYVVKTDWIKDYGSASSKDDYMKMIELINSKDICYQSICGLF